MNGIKYLELELLKPEIRKNKKRLEELIAENFVEIASSGVILKKKDILINLPKEEKINWDVKNFKTIIISKDAILVTYKATKRFKNRQSNFIIKKFFVEENRQKLANNFSPRNIVKIN